VVTAYDERLTVPLRWWVQASMLVASLWLALVVAVPHPVAWSVTAVALALMTLLMRSYGAARIVVVDGMLHVGNARIEARHLGRAEALDAEQARRVAGVEADVRAFLLLRPYLSRAVKVEVTDPADPAPYWLISTRHPEKLVGAVLALTGRDTPA
jgi:hypothetical protein